MPQVRNIIKLTVAENNDHYAENNDRKSANNFLYHNKKGLSAKQITCT